MWSAWLRLAERSGICDICEPGWEKVFTEIDLKYSTQCEGTEISGRQRRRQEFTSQFLVSEETGTQVSMKLEWLRILMINHYDLTRSTSAISEIINERTHVVPHARLSCVSVKSNSATLTWSGFYNLSDIERPNTCYLISRVWCKRKINWRRRFEQHG